MDAMLLKFEIEIGLPRKAESRFGRPKKPAFKPEGGFQPFFGKFVNTP